MKQIVRISLVRAIILLATPCAAQAGIVINIDQSGANVVATLYGSLNLPAPDQSYVQPFFNGLQNYNYSNNLFFSSNPNTATAVNLWAVSVPFGSGDWGTSSNTLDFISPSSYSASGFSAFGFRIRGSAPDQLYLDQGYVSGTTMNATWQMDNTTLAAMDLTNLGTYVYGVGNDTVTVNIAVPEPSISIMGLIGAAMLFRRKR